jgi:hypothetical protein
MSPRLKSAYVKVTIHFGVLFAVAWILVAFFPKSIEYLPVGTAEKLFVPAKSMGFETTVHSGRLEGGSIMAFAIFFLLCFLCSILMAIPVGTTYMGTHSNKKTSASLAKMLIGMPIVVAGLVLIVQNSLALAFSLTGIVAGAGIRFRTNLREFTDTLFFLATIGIGISAGIGALGISYYMSLVFCYTILTVHAIGYGEVNSKDVPLKYPENSE